MGNVWDMSDTLYTLLRLISAISIELMVAGSRVRVTSPVCSVI